MTEDQVIAFEKKAKQSDTNLEAAIAYFRTALQCPSGSIGRRLRIQDALEFVLAAQKIEEARATLGF